MPAYRVLIVDDEPLARKRVRTFLEEHSDMEIVGECAEGTEAVASIRQEKPDIVFLDIQMPRLTGFEVLQTIEPNEIPIVIFVTAYEQHALKAFDVEALAQLDLFYVV